MELRNLSAVLAFLSILTVYLSSAAPVDTRDDTYSDAASITDLLTLCNSHPSLCSEEARFYETSIHTIRQSGVRKSSAILMADILRICIDKGLDACDEESTAIALNAISMQRKHPTDSSQKGSHRKLHSYSSTLLSRQKRNLHNSNAMSIEKSISSAAYVKNLRSDSETGSSTIEDNSYALPTMHHSISKRALGGIIRQMIKGLCRSDPLSCYEVTRLHPNQRRRISNYR